jgi:hypothetical protein
MEILKDSLKNDLKSILETFESEKSNDWKFRKLWIVLSAAAAIILVVEIYQHKTSLEQEYKNLELDGYKQNFQDMFSNFNGNEETIIFISKLLKFK